MKHQAASAVPLPPAPGDGGWPRLPTVSDVYPDPRAVWLAVFAGLGVVFGCARLHLGWGWWMGGLVICLVLAGVVTRRAVVDYSRGSVREESLLFGRRLLSLREFPFGDFSAIVYERRRNETEDLTFVGLEHRLGRRFWLRGFSNGGVSRGRGAEEFAWRLSCDTGIEIREGTR